MPAANNRLDVQRRRCKIGVDDGSFNANGGIGWLSGKSRPNRGRWVLFGVGGFTCQMGTFGKAREGVTTHQVSRSFRHMKTLVRNLQGSTHALQSRSWP
jgi:hypothetical protein